MTEERFIITGVPRAGKTILSKRVALEAAISHLHVDSLIEAFHRTYPEIGISHDGESLAQLSQAVKPFLYNWLDLHCFYRIPFVADVYHVQIEDLVSFRDKHDVQLVYVGYPLIKPEEKLALLRANSTDPDWARTEPDTAMLEFLSRCQDRSSKMVDICKTHGVKYVDTGGDFSHAIEQAVSDLLGERRVNNRLQLTPEVGRS